MYSVNLLIICDCHSGAIVGVVEMLAWISLDHGSSPSLSRREHWRNNVKESFAGLSVWETSSLRTEPGTSERKSVFEPLSRRICRICSTHVCFKRKDFFDRKQNPSPPTFLVRNQIRTNKCRRHRFRFEKLVFLSPLWLYKTFSRQISTSQSSLLY